MNIITIIIIILIELQVPNTMTLVHLTITSWSTKSIWPSLARVLRAFDHH